MPPKEQWLYINLDIGAGQDSATSRLAFIAGETTEALTLRALECAEITPYIPFASRVSVSVDGGATFSCDKKTVVAEYPKRGDVVIKVQKKPATLYVHFFDESVVKQSSELAGRFDQPLRSVAISVPAASAADGANVTRRLLQALLPTKGEKLGPSDSVSAKFSRDGGFVDLAAGDAAAFAAFPFNGDVFVIQSSASASATPARELDFSAYNAALQTAQKLVEQGQFGAAAEFFKKTLNDFFGPTDREQCVEAALPVWQQLALIHSQGSGMHDKASFALRKCLSILRAMPASVDQREESLNIAFTLAKELFEAKQYRESANTFQEAFEMLGRFANLESGAVKLPSSLIREMRIRLGAALYKGGMKQQGMAMVQEALGGDTKCDIGLFWMSKFYAEMDHDADALQWGVALLVKENANKEYRANFAELVSGMADAAELLKKRVLTGTTPKHGQLWCFLGRVLQDFGQMLSAKQFYEEGIRLDESNANYCLNYVHLLEHMNKLPQAMEHIHKFLVRRGPVNVGLNKKFMPDSLTIANLIVGAKPVPAKVLRVIAAELTGMEFEAAAAADEEAAKQGGAQVEAAAWSVPQPALPTDAIQLIEPVGGKPMGDFRTVEYFAESKDRTPQRATAAAAAASSASRDNKDNDSRPKNNGLFAEEDLNLVGIYFTAVKLLFCMGALDRLPLLIAAINPIRKHNQFHNTIMKNEHSYFTTISQAVQSLTFAAPLSASPVGEKSLLLTATYLAEPVTKCVYYVGDSHSVPCSWHILRNYGGEAGQDRMIVNRLVTGLKCWHLREEGTFYPKRQFEAVTASLPQGADVIFNFGEIDCRESVLQVVNRGLYDSVDDVYRELGKMYLAAILDVRRQRRLGRVFVLGPLPVLDATRHLVVACNKVFAALFNGSKDAQAHKLVFIDPCDKVLCPNEENPAGQRSSIAVKGGEERVLRKEFEFDSTHIHPLFVSKVLEPAISEGMRRSF